MTITAPTELALKRKKSLTRSLSSAFRSKSRPTSPAPPDVDTPPTPLLPTEYRPSTAGTSHAPSPVLDRVHHGKDNQDANVSKEAPESEQKVGQPEAPLLAVKKKRSIRKISLRQSRQKSWTTGDDTLRPCTASAIDGLGASGADDSLETIKRVKPKKSLIIHHERAQSRERAASATIPLSKTSPATAQISRPTTFGASLPSPVTSSNGRQRGNSSPRGGFAKASPDPFDLPPSPRLPWQVSQNPSEARSSFRSAATATSSRTNTTRNSVLTKETALTDVTVDSPSSPIPKDEGEGMTVDEAIEMYAAGFTDDPEEPVKSQEVSISGDERSRSARIFEAMSDNMGSSIMPSSTPSSPRPSTSGSTQSKSVRSASFSQPALTYGTTFPYGASRDQYGFLKYNHYITRTVYDAWFADYYPSQLHRCYKWVTYMKEQKLATENPTKFPSRSAKTQRYIRKGIPPAWRGAAWFHYAHGESYIARHPQLYNNLLHLTEQKLSENDKEAIERDLHRTFPDNVRFKPDIDVPGTEDTEMLASLRRLLRAFAVHKPEIGYCQSLNFIAAMLLLFLPEEKAFWMLHIITVLYLPATHNVSLEGANVDLWVLAVALKTSNPGVWAKVGGKGLMDEDGKKSRLPPISLCATSWFMGLFIGTLPTETVLRVWGMYFQPLNLVTYVADQQLIVIRCAVL